MSSIESSRFSDKDDSSSEDAPAKDSSPSVPRWSSKPPIIPVFSESASLSSVSERRPIPFSPMFSEFATVSTLERDKHSEVEEDDSEDDEDEDEEVATTAVAVKSEDASLEQAPVESEQTENILEDDRPVPPITDTTAVQPDRFEEIMRQMGPEYADAVSGPELNDIEPAESETAQTVAQETSVEHHIPLEQEGEEADIPLTAAAGGSVVPPRPPIIPPNEQGAFNTPEEPEPSPTPYVSLTAPPRNVSNAQASPNTAPVQFYAPEQSGMQTTAEANKRELRLRFAAGFITGYAVKAFLANRKLARYQRATEKQQDLQNQEATQLRAEYTTLQSRVAAQAEQLNRYARSEQPQNNPANQSARFEAPKVEATKPLPETLPPIQLAPEQQIFDQEGNEITLQPGQRIERSAGGYSVVVDQHNRIVHNVIRYGEAFQRDQKREQVSDDVFAASGVGVQTNNDQGIALPAMPAPINNDQVDSAHILAAYTSPHADVQHRLDAPRNPVVTAVSSPWLWTGIAVLLIAYFIAALV